VACPLLEGIDLSGARGVLVLIAANKNNFKLSESRAAMNTIRRYAADDAHVIFGAAYDDTLGDQLRVTVIATGLSRARPQAAPLTVVQPTTQHATQQALRTGTDNLPILNHVLATPQQGGAGQSGQTNYDTLSTPSVWRTNRHHAAAKVEALSSNGMDDIEIPAFLRKQAD
jgi:cell division protein FtsZ